MKPSRFELLHTDSGTAHIFWRCHNKEYYLAKDINKALYMNCLTDCLQKKHLSHHGKVLLSSYCVMSNHFHCIITYHDGSKHVSNFTRNTNSPFGFMYNKNHKRSGKVAESRFKSSLIENTEHAIRVHFYIEANPIRAGLVTLKNLHKYKYCSYRFYAYGIKDEYTQYLTQPEWYLALGKTALQRQKKYRILFKMYLNEESKTNSLRPVILSYFIGSVRWQEEQRTQYLEKVRVKRIKKTLNSS